MSIMPHIRRLGRGIIYVGCLLLTVFISANSYEIASGKDLPFLNSIQQVDLDSLNPTIERYTKKQLLDEKKEGNFGRPETLRVIIDDKPLRTIIAPGIADRDNWLARANTSHLLYLGNSKSGNSADMLIYLSQSWRTIPHPEKIAQGSNIFIDTNTGWRYMFRVEEIQSVNKNAQIVLPETRTTQIVLAINEPGSKDTIIIRGQFLSLLNIGA
jgi:hypothetical protein